jgi:acetoin utilization protein AcuB
MTRNPITVLPQTSVPDALRIMREMKVRRLPVLDKDGNLVGIVSEKDLLYASPSPATTLSIWEIPDLLSRITVEKVMTKEVITVEQDKPLEEAALIMADHRVGGLPVMHGKTLTGIITETDLFKVFVTQLGARRAGVRLTAVVPNIKGLLARVTQAVYAIGGNIVGLGLGEVAGKTGMVWEITLKVQDVTNQALVEALKPVVDEIVDVREV